MALNEQKAQKLVTEAQKKLSASKGFFSSLFGGASKIEDAVECYQKAANLFKITKNWMQAGSAFCEAANLHVNLGSRYEAASNYVDAAKCYKKSDLHKALNCFLRAIEIYTDMGRFALLAKYHQVIAEMYENDAINIELATEHYEQAADYFGCEDSTLCANKCLLKVACYMAQLQNYQKAIEIYEQVAISCLENPLLKYSAKEYLFRAALCHLCVDLVSTQHALEHYVQIYPVFQDSRECKLVKALAEHLEEENVDAFTDAVKEYDSVMRLDEWFTMILLRVKKQISENPDIR